MPVPAEKSLGYRPLPGAFLRAGVPEKDLTAPGLFFYQYSRLGPVFRHVEIQDLFGRIELKIAALRRRRGYRYLPDVENACKAQAAGDQDDKQAAP